MVRNFCCFLPVIFQQNFFPTVFFPKKWDFCPNSQKCFFPRECSYFQYIILRVVIIVFFLGEVGANFCKMDKNKMSISQMFVDFPPEFFADLDKHVFYIYELTR